MEKHICYVQHSFYCLLGIRTVLSPVRQVFVKSHLPSDGRVLQLQNREGSENTSYHARRGGLACGPSAARHQTVQRPRQSRTPFSSPLGPWARPGIVASPDIVCVAQTLHSRFGWRLYVRLFCRLKRDRALTGINLLLSVWVSIKAHTKCALMKYTCIVNIAETSLAYVIFCSSRIKWSGSSGGTSCCTHCFLAFGHFQN